MPATSAITPCTPFSLVRKGKGQAKGGPNLQATYATDVRLRPAGPEKTTPEQ